MTASSWSLTPFAFRSPLYAWTDSPNGKYGSGETTLTSHAIAINNGAAPVISFQTCYDINTDGDQGKLQVKAAGGNWLDLPGPAYTGVTNGWLQQLRTGLPLIGTNSFEFRFVMEANNSGSADGWYVDDITLTLDYDLDNDGIPNDVEVGPNPNNPRDTDGDGIPDFLEGSGIFLPLITKNR
jgi:hypothetical protein